MIAKTNALIFCAHVSSQTHYENVKKLVNYIKNKVDADCFVLLKKWAKYWQIFWWNKQNQISKIIFPLFLFGNHLLIDVKKKFYILKIALVKMLY